MSKSNLALPQGMKTKTISILSGAVALATSAMVLGLSNPVSAAQLWNWSYSGGGTLGGSGRFTTSDVRSDGAYLITDIMETAERESVGSFPSDPPKTNDNWQVCYRRLFVRSCMDYRWFFGIVGVSLFVMLVVKARKSR